MSALEQRGWAKSAIARCERCGSKAPHLHPAVQFGGEVGICANAFHLTETPQNRPDYIRAVREKIATLATVSRAEAPPIAGGDA